VRANLVGVVTTVPPCSPRQHRPARRKPVMEGKGVLFKKFAGIDVFDIELDEPDRRS